MNYLAHALLSGTDTDLIIGNFIADAVRGKQVLQFSQGIRNGIFLHREIDAFTDSHEIVAQSKNRLRTDYSKYAPVIADMFYDHFLARNFSMFSAVSLEEFADNIYELMQQNFDLMPERVKHFLPHMIRHNWLASYAEISGIEKALNGLSRRTTFVSGMETAAAELKENYAAYESEFLQFFPALQLFTEELIQKNQLATKNEFKI